MVAMSLLRLTPNSVIEFPTALPNATSLLILENVSDQIVAFKVKTTAPKHYLVRPSTGVINPNSSHEVRIVMQPHPQDTSADRFLVQAVAIEDGASINKDFWVNVQKSVVQDQRLLVSIKSTTTDGPPTSLLQMPPTTWASTPDDGGSDMKRPSPADDGAAAARQQASQPSINNNPSSTQVKYDEMVQYCLALEKQNARLTESLDAARQSISTLETRLKNSPNVGGAQVSILEKKGFELWQVVALIIGVVALMKICGWL